MASIDVESDVSQRRIPEYFSCLLPPAMFFRHVFQDQCWRPGNVPHATLVIDDPPLWRSYGFLNYERLLALMEQFQFHTTIAFIPYYWQKGSLATIRLFRERPDRLSICFHGNDHTHEEFATTNVQLLDRLLLTAQARMESHEKLTGIPCDKVMVLPQGCFSHSAIQALKGHNFIAAVNSGHLAQGDLAPLTMLDVMQPSFLAYSDFPLFLRTYAQQLRREDITLSAFLSTDPGC